VNLPENDSENHSDNHAVLVAGPSIEAREERLTSGADDLAGSRSAVVGGRNVLVVAAAALVTTGLTAILLGWVGAAHSTIVAEQLPYLISGGLLGLALSVVGAIVYFAHWLTVLVREAREHEAARARDHTELMEALRSLPGPMAREEATDGTARSEQRERPIRRAPRSS
jgi:hypothetical protein